MLVLQRHTWYLTEELIPLSLFDTKLPDETLNFLAQKIAQLSDGDIMIKKQALPKILSTSVISDFVGPRSTVLFKTHEVTYSFLALSNWRYQLEYHHVKTATRNFTPLNDCIERALVLATTFCGVGTLDESSHQNRILVVEAHKKKYHLSNKSELRTVLNWLCKN